MSLLVVGLSHRSAPVPVLERAAVPLAETGKVLDELLKKEHVAEALLLSTCNRVEIYAVVQTFHGGLDDITAVLERQSGTMLDELSDHLYVHYAAAAIEHMFAVASGLDSMVVGEPQILGQLRAAYATAEQSGTVGSTLHGLTQQALRVGKRVHTETEIDTEGVSLVSEALVDAAAALGTDQGLAGRRALVIGAGSMGGLTTAMLRRAGVAEIVLANRTLASAQRLATLCEAEGVPARAVPLEALGAALASVDLVVCCTGAVDAVLSVEQVTHTRHCSAAPLVVCDLGLPRDVEAGVGDLPGVMLIDISTVARRLERRDSVEASSEAPTTTEHAWRIVADEVRGYLAAQRTAEVTPTVTALRRRAAEVVDAELLRLDGRLPGLDSAVREELVRTIQRVVDKLLHTPTVRVKQLAETGGGQAYADALRELFGLDSQTVAAVAAPVRSMANSEPDDRTPAPGTRISALDGGMTLDGGAP